MHPAVALGLAAACLAGAAICHHRRDAILLLATRLRGFEPSMPGSRRRYQRGLAGRLDMLAPVVFFVLLGLAFAVRALLSLLCWIGAPDANPRA